jgi:hypothetical protein
VDAFDDLPDVLGCLKYVMNVNSANYEDSLIGFDFPSHFGTQSAVARVYFARLQRAPEGSDHSTAQGGYNVIKGCRMRLGEFCGIEAIVLGNSSMDTEHYGLRLPRQASESKRPRPPLNLNLGHIDGI